MPVGFLHCKLDFCADQCLGVDLDAAWVQVSEGKIPVRAVFKTISGFKHAGAAIAESNCWSMIKGGLTVDESGPAELYFEVT